MTTIDDRKEQAAEIAGTDHVGRVVLEIQELLNRGILIDLHVHGLGIFDMATSWEEWGIADDDPRKTSLKRGRRSAAKELHGKLRSVETRIRNLGPRFGRRITGMGGWWWVPFTAYDKFTAEWDRLDGELVAIREEIITRRDDLVADLAIDMAGGARRAWASIEAQRPPDAGPFVLRQNGDTFEDLDAYVEHERARAAEIFPTVERIRSHVYAAYSNAILMTSAELLAEHSREEQAKRDAAIAALEAQTARDEMSRQEIEAELEIAEMKAQHEAKVKAMRDAEIQRAREMLRDVKSPWQDVIDQYRAEVHGKVAKLAESLKRNGELKGRSLGMARDLHKLYQIFGSATDDRDLEKKLENLADLLAPAIDDQHEAMTTVTVKGALDDILAFTSDAAREIAQAARTSARKTAIDVVDLDL